MSEQGRLFNMPVPQIAALNSCQEGTWRELLVAGDLIQRGFVVFMRQGNGGSPDLAILGPNGTLARVEVKSETSSHSVRWEETDLLAVVSESGEISYFYQETQTGNRKGCDPVLWFETFASELTETLSQIIEGMKETEQRMERTEQRLDSFENGQWDIVKWEGEEGIWFAPRHWPEEI